MITAAGILFQTPDGKALFLRRSSEGDAAGLWAFPGGKIEEGETASDAASRECFEETGFRPGAPGSLLCRRVKDGVDFTTFIKKVDEPFTPKLNDEHSAFVWMDATEAGNALPLHPGAITALAMVGADELMIARLMANGEIPSPQTYHNVSLFKIRITGTGISFRPTLNEYVYRKPENYLTGDFVSRCNGLPVIMNHPTGNLLNSKEFSERVVGSVMMAFVEGDEVWAIAKLFDAETIKMLGAKQMSTSPAVMLDKGFKIKLEDGTHLLVEGKASLLDHIAICEIGVWDKGEGPTGIDSELLIGDTAMADKDEDKMKADAEEKMKADKVKADSDKLDMILKGISDAATKVDAVCARMDAFEEKSKADAAKADAARKDAEEGEEAKRLAFDKSKKDAAEEKNPALKEEKDEKEAAAKKDSEDEEDKKKADAARADAVARLDTENRDLRRRLDDLTTMVRQPVSDSHRTELTTAQARADEVFIQHGDRAPQYLVGEAPTQYRKRLAGLLQKHSDKWSKFKLDSIDNDNFATIEGEIYSDALVRAKTPNDIPSGKMREVRKTLASGHVVTEFYGDSSFVKQFSRPARRVSGIFNGR